MNEHTSLPAPLVPGDVDLQDFKFMPLDVQRLRDSDLASDETPEACWAAVLLWCASWHQIPAGSVPNNDEWLAKHAGYKARGKIDKGWFEVKAGAMRGWVLCNDNRLYHPVVVEKALDAWRSKLEQRWKTECSRIKKHNQRHQMSLSLPEFEAWMASGCPLGHALPVPGDTGQLSQGHAPPVPRDTPPVSLQSPSKINSKRQGEGQRDLKEETPIAPLPPPSAGKPKREQRPLCGLKAWLDATKAAGEKPVPDGDLVFAYADDIGLPREFLHLAWVEFRHRYAQPDAKRYRDWRAVFRKAIRGNWLKLWYLDGTTFALTTIGLQARIARDKAA